MNRNIYINARFLAQNITGVQRFALEICNELIKLRKDIIFLIPCSFDQTLIPKDFNILTVGKRSGLYWEQVELPAFLKKEGYPLLVNLCNRAPIFYNNNIVAIHDVTFRRYPKSVSFCFGLFYKLILPRIVSYARYIITVSNFSMDEIKHFYPKSQGKITVIYNAVDSNFVPNNKATEPSNYLLAVSSDYTHKNFDMLVQAFILLDDPCLKLKIVGSKGKIANKYIDKKNIEFLGRITDQELVKLYQSALAFIFPSLYEGFGIPPLEAQACACPVVASNKASMPEILGNSVLFFEPTDINNIMAKMKIIISDNSVRNNLIELGMKNVTKFSWRDSAQKLNELITNNIKNK